MIQHDPKIRFCRDSRLLNSEIIMEIFLENAKFHPNKVEYL